MKDKVFFEEYIKSFLRQNSCLNLISKNDEKFLWEKHIYDSLSIEFFLNRYIKPDRHLSLLDFGTGGGFPSIPIALAFSEIDVTAVDSIRKKVNAVNNIKEELDIRNLNPVCARVETLNETFDIVTSRAVAPLDRLVEYAVPRLKKDGYFVAYKSRRADDEITAAASILKKYNAKILDIIDYNLPLKENFSRNLIIISRGTLI